MSTIVRNPQVISDEVEGTRMLCHTGYVEFFRLNPTAAQIWDLCEGNDLNEIIERLRKLYPGESHEYLAQEAQRFVRSLAEAHLVEITG